MRTKRSQELIEDFQAFFTGPPGPAGAPGTAGRGITNISVNENSHLILQMSDNTSIDAGQIDTIPGPPGEDGATGATGATGAAGRGITSIDVDEDGHLILTMTDSTEIDAGYVIGPQGPAGSGSGTGQGYTYIASNYATAQQAIDAAKGHLLILDKKFMVSAPLAMHGTTYDGIAIIGTDPLNTGFEASISLEGPVLDVRCSSFVFERFTISGGNKANTVGIWFGDHQTNTYQCKKGSVKDVVVKQTTSGCITFWDQIDYLDFYNLRAVDENTGKCIYIDNRAGTIYDNGNVRFFGCFFSSVLEVFSRYAIAGSFHRINFIGCQFNGSNGANIQIDTSNIHECCFIGCTQETSGGAPIQAMLKISGINQTFINHTLSGNGLRPGVSVIYLDSAYGPYAVLGLSIQNWDNNTVGISSSGPVRLKGAEDTIFVGNIGTKFDTNVVVGQDTYNPSIRPTLLANGQTAIYFDGTNYYFEAKIAGQLKRVQLS